MMYGWWENVGSPPFFGVFHGPLAIIVFLVVAVLIVAWVVRTPGSGPQSTTRERSALDILRERFARGEIDRKEYEERKQLLSGS
jgi:putative membrane protein